MAKKQPKNLENTKNPMFDDLVAGKVVIPERKEASHAPKNASNRIRQNQEKFSTPVENQKVFKTRKNTMDEYPIIQTHYRRVHRLGEVKKTPSLTEPGHSTTVLQVLDRFRRGLPVYGTKGTPVFDGEIELPDLKRMDLTEREELLRQAKADLNAAREKANELAAKKRREQQEKDFEEAVQKRLAMRDAKDDPQDQPGTNNT